MTCSRYGRLTHALIHSRRGQIVTWTKSQVDAEGEPSLKLAFPLMSALTALIPSVSH